MSYLLGLVDASGSSAALAYAQLMVPGQPSAMVQPAKTLPPLPPPVPLPAVPLPLPALPPDDEPADDDAPPDDEPADDDVPPVDEPADDDVPPVDEPADDGAPADDGEPADDDEPDVETEDEPADVEPEEAPPDELEPSGLPLFVPQATTTGVTASANMQAIDELRISGNPRCLGGAVAPVARRRRLATVYHWTLNPRHVFASRRPTASVNRAMNRHPMHAENFADFLWENQRWRHSLR
jgi:hypothetical protein